MVTMMGHDPLSTNVGHLIEHGPLILTSGDIGYVSSMTLQVGGLLCVFSSPCGAPGSGCYAGFGR